MLSPLCRGRLPAGTVETHAQGLDAEHGSSALLAFAFPGAEGATAHADCWLVTYELEAEVLREYELEDFAGRCRPQDLGLAEIGHGGDAGRLGDDFVVPHS